MKLHASPTQTLNTVTAYGPGWIEINARRHQRPVLVRPEGEVLDWVPPGFEALAPEHFETILALGPEVVLLGTGPAQRFPHPRLIATLTSRGIGVESMDTGAACRTYNILMVEGRKVLAALIPV